MACIVDAAKLGISTEQIDYNCGYVNGWTTESFSEYVKSKNQNIIILPVNIDVLHWTMISFDLNKKEGKLKELLTFT